MHTEPFGLWPIDRKTKPCFIYFFTIPPLSDAKNRFVFFDFVRKHKLLCIWQHSTNEPQRTFENKHQTKIQISLRICAVWSESSLCAFWIGKGAKFLHVNNEDLDQTARMRRLIWVFVGVHFQTVRF